MDLGQDKRLKFGQEVDYLIANSDNPYLSEAAMHADQANQKQGYIYVVENVGHFEKLSTSAGVAGDYRQLSGKTEKPVTSTVFVNNTVLGSWATTNWENVAGPDGEQTTLKIDISDFNVGDEIEGSVSKGHTAEFVPNAAGEEIIVPYGYTTKIAGGGVFGIKILTSTSCVLFGTLIPK